MGWRAKVLAAGIAVALVGERGPGVLAQQDPTGHGGHGVPARPAGPPAPRTPIRISPEHGAHDLVNGAPPGWTFSLPAGNPTEGRRLFIDLECFKCHAVRGETFPGTPADVGDRGPDLSAMGLHSAEYLAESIINPNAVLVDSPKYLGPDGLSKMPSYNEDITVQELLDLVAYLTSLGQAGTPPRH